MLKPILIVAACALVVQPGFAAEKTAGYQRLLPLSAPKITAHAEDYPGGNHSVSNLVDGNPRTEYSSNAKGTNTFVEFDFGKVVSIAAFKHQDRNDPATVAASELEFLDSEGRSVGKELVRHGNQRGAVSVLTLPQPIAARKVLWSVRQLGPQKYGTVGGAEVLFYTLGLEESQPRGLRLEVAGLMLLERREPAPVQPVRVSLDYPYQRPARVVLKIEGADPIQTNLVFGTHQFEARVPAATSARILKVTVEANGQVVAGASLPLKPVRPMEIYLLPHSHVDIGYTELQPEVEKKQNQNLEIGLDLIRRSREYPEGSRFRWNAEVMWPIENYLRVATPEKRQALLEAIKNGEVGLDALYGNILTGLCRPEELVRMMTYAAKMQDLCGVKVESAMISDVPGYTWSTVSALAQAGVKYFSFAPNYFDRMGGTMVLWQNKPFYWEGPDGRSRILCWCPSKGYALGHLIGDGENLARYLPSYMQELQTNGYPYDITHVRWNVHGDNGSPDEKHAAVVRDWNAKYLYPKLIITTTADAFRKFEARYGKQLPVYRGDYTPYWEDGAGSSARETAQNRASAERLVQAETVWSLRQPGPFPADDFYTAWRNILLYSEHTWGAHNSISQPDIPFVKDQWRIKQAFAVDADKQSRTLFESSFDGGALAEGLDVFNTTSWPRTDLVILPAGMSAPGDRVVDEQNRVTASQRLASGELAFLAENVPPLGGRRYRVLAGKAQGGESVVTAEGMMLRHPLFRLRLDEQTGGIASLYHYLLKVELVDPNAKTGLNDYFYLPGADVKGVQRNGPVRVSVRDRGPLVASLLVESDAPGCKSLAREIRVVAGLDRIELVNTVDKLAVRAKEGLHFGYGFNVPKGTVRVDVGWAVVRPNVDQIPAACKNWFSAQRWVDVSNSRYGVTLMPLDAPLIEIGGLTANLIGSQTDHRVWITELPPSQTIYSWFMNNHWHTNYRADQDGPTVFRYVLRPHGAYSPLETARAGVAATQPLIAARARGVAPAASRFTLSSDAVLVTAFKPADDGQGSIVRLYGAAGKTVKTSLRWSDPAPKSTWLSDTSEKPLKPVHGPITVPAWGIVTLRLEK